MVCARDISLLSNIEDMELLHLSRNIPPDKYIDIGIYLGLNLSELDGISIKRQNNIKGSLMEVFVTWRDGQESNVNKRKLLAECLRNAELDSLAEDLLNRRLGNRGRPRFFLFLIPNNLLSDELVNYWCHDHDTKI